MWLEEMRTHVSGWGVVGALGWGFGAQKSGRRVCPLVGRVLGQLMGGEVREADRYVHIVWGHIVCGATIETMTSLGRHTIFQNSLMSALLDGIYDGEMTIGEILSKGNFGLGTFDGLDGEMIILDGSCYQLRSDGSATIADLDQKSPFAQVTNFVPKIVAKAPKGMKRSELSKFIDDLEPSGNYFHAVRIKGTFTNVTTRTVTKQSKPYPPMREAVGDDKEITFENARGIIGGFRTPKYAKGIGVPGCHVHFINEKRTSGGHVLDYTVEDAVIELCPGTDMELHLPLTADFAAGNLSPDDIDEQIHSTEVKS